MHQARSGKGVPYSFSSSSVQFQGHTAKKSTTWTKIEHSWTITQDLIQRWLRNDAQTLKWHRRGVLLFCFFGHLLVFFWSSFKFQGHIAEKSMIWLWFAHFQMTTPIWLHGWLWNDTHICKEYPRNSLLFFDVICQISRSHRLKNWFGSHLRLQGRSQLSNPSDLPCFWYFRCWWFGSLDMRYCDQYSRICTIMLWYIIHESTSSRYILPDKVLMH